MPALLHSDMSSALGILQKKLSYLPGVTLQGPIGLRRCRYLPCTPAIPPYPGGRIRVPHLSSTRLLKRLLTKISHHKYE